MRMSIRRDGHPPSSIPSMSGASAGVAGLRRSCRSLPLLLILALAACVLTPASAMGQAQGKPIRVLLLYGVSPELPEVVNFTKQLRVSMRGDSGRPVEFYPEYLDFERFPNSGPRLARYLEEKYRPESIDVIVTV